MIYHSGDTFVISLQEIKKKTLSSLLSIYIASFFNIVSYLLLFYNNNKFILISHVGCAQPLVEKGDTFDPHLKSKSNQKGC